MSHCIIKSLPDMAKARNRVDQSKVIYDDFKPSEALLSFAKGKKYLVKTFGCQGNVRDEEVISGYLERMGYAPAKDEEEANIVIINTCAVRENAEDKVYGEIGKFKAKSKADPDFVLGICGCMMQEEGKAKKLFASYPYIDLVFGTHNIVDLPKLLEEHIKTHKSLLDVISYPGDIIEGLPSIRLDPYKAYVNISYGCDKFCTYCIVPYTRGRERSRPLQSIVEECQKLVEQGYKEITLLGQNVNSYGKDFHDGTSFATVLEEVAKLGIPRLRFMTSHPYDFSLPMLDVIAKYPNIMKCIHLPVQSGSTEVLRQMGRRYTREQYLQLVEEVRKRIPDCAITTDIIVGFPNETEEQFEDTLSLCEQVKYDAAFTFIYSPRAGTPAAKMVDNVSDEVKHERFDRLLKVIEKGVMYHSAKMVGNTYDVLVDGPSKKDKSMLSGYTEKGKLINFKGPECLSGQIVKVKIIEDHAFSMIGELAEDPFSILLSSASEALKNEPEYKSYLEAKKAFEEDASLQELLKEKEAAQRDLAISLDKEDYPQKKARFQQLDEAVQSHPVYCNFMSSVEDLRGLLEQAKKVLQ